jgi:hypothetical protein
MFFRKSPHRKDKNPRPVRLANLALFFVLPCLGCTSEQVATASSRDDGDETAASEDAGGTAGSTEQPTDAGTSATDPTAPTAEQPREGGTASNGDPGPGDTETVDAGDTPGTPDMFPPLPEPMAAPDVNSPWYVDTASLSTRTSLWAWPLSDGGLQRALAVTPRDELWTMPLRSSSPDKRRYAFLREEPDATTGCHGYVVDFGSSGPELTSYCYPRRDGIETPRALRWLDDRTLLVAFREPDHEEVEAVQWFVHELPVDGGDARIAELLPNLSNVAEVSVSPDAQRFLISTGWPESPALFLVERQAESDGLLLSAGSSFRGETEQERGVSWEPNAQAVVVRDAESAEQRVFDLRESPVEVEFDTSAYVGTREYVFGGQTLYYVAITEEGTQKLLSFDWQQTADQLDGGAAAPEELALPSSVLALSAIGWDAQVAGLFGLATLSPESEARSTLIRIAPAEGGNGVQLLSHVGREVLAPVTLTTDGALLARSRPVDDLSASSLLRWPENTGTEGAQYFGPEHAPYQKLMGYFLAPDPSQFVLNLRGPNLDEQLVWYQGDVGQVLPSVERTQSLEWLPNSVGVVLRSTSGLLWADFRSGAPKSLFDIGPEY